MNNKEIKSIEFVFENCECVEIPYNCFTKFEIKNLDELNNGDIFESLQCVIEDRGGTKYTCGGFEKTPIQRIDYYNDITSIYIIYKDNTQLKLICPWYEENEYCNSQYNDFQTSKMESFNKIELSIINNSKWFSLEEALDKFKDQDIIIDKNGNEYVVRTWMDCVNYLSDTIVTNILLKSKFQKVS